MTEHPRFDGADYVPARDDGRLTSQLGRVKALMSDEEWRTLDSIAEATGDPPASVSAQLRHLRKARFGGYLVDRRCVGDGLYEYRVQRREVRPEHPRVSEGWSPQRRAAFSATVAARRAERATPPPRGPRCDMCHIRDGEETRRGFKLVPAKVLTFSLIRTVVGPNGRHTTRGAGSIFLCERDWLATGARRRKRRSAAA